MVNVLELIMSVCLIDTPTKCKDVHFNSSAQTTMQCMSDITTMADWIGKNPKWVITKWHCTGAGTEASL